MLPKKQPIANPVSEFCDNLLTERFQDAPESDLLHLIVVNGANADPNGVIDMLVELHDKIGDFVTKMNDGEFREWTAPEPEPVKDAAELNLLVPEVDSAVLELP